MPGDRGGSQMFETFDPAKHETFASGSVREHAGRQRPVRLDSVPARCSAYVQTEHWARARRATLLDQTEYLGNTICSPCVESGSPSSDLVHSCTLETSVPS